MTPPEVIDNPVGSPVADHVLVPVPPVAVEVTDVYARFTVQSLSTVGNVIATSRALLHVTGGPGRTTIPIFAWFVPTFGTPTMWTGIAVESGAGTPTISQVSALIVTTDMGT